MPPKLVLIGCIVFVIWLLRIEQKRNPIASRALWVPTFWLLIMGSRPVGAWFMHGSQSGGSDAAGSPLDRLVLNSLILIALFVLSRRKMNWSRVFKDNLWLILLYVYLGTSVLWSDFPFSSFKRWFKITGAVVMAFVVLSELKPLQALESVIRRCAYVLIPLSIVLIKYFPEYGVVYSPWEGTRMGTGVTTHKNSLGVLCALSLFFLIWAALRKWRSGEFSKNRSYTYADALVIGIALFLLFGGGGTSSATSIFIFIVGITSLLILYRMKNLTRYMANHLKAVMIAGLLIFLLFNSLLLPMVTSSFDRNESLTGRTDIWRSVLEVASHNPLLGTGYGGYWGLAPGAFTKNYGVKQSHNGYLDVYLQVGIVGIVALFAFFLAFCGKVRRELNHVFDWGVFGICFLLMVLLYNYTEASFIETSYMWTVTVFLSVVFSGLCLHTNAAKETENEQGFKEQNT